MIDTGQRAADQPDISLVPIDRQGTPGGMTGDLPAVAREVITATVALYATVGFQDPWLGYLALIESRPVGACGFKSAPVDGRVEIAYFTFPGFEGRGIATAMAAGLIGMVRRENRPLIVAAQTRPEKNASTRVLEKLGFSLVGPVDHPEDGRVWEWQLGPG